MKALWSWLLRLFGYKAVQQFRYTPPVPAPAPTKPPTPIRPSSGTPVIPDPLPGAPSAPGIGVPPSVPAPVPSPIQPSPVVTPDPSPVLPSPVVAPEPPPVPQPVPVVPGLPVLPVAPLVLPIFSDDFSAGHLDTSKWILSTWSAPGNIPGVHSGLFTPDSLDFSHGCLRIRVSQTSTPSGEVTSQGGELQSRQRFGFGTYEWILRASSTSETPQGSGRPVSGQISSGFIYFDGIALDEYTEIDSPEIEGDKPDQMSWTSWTDDKTREYTATGAAPFPEASFHSYKCVWLHDSISFYVDGVPVAHHSVHIPQNPAYAMINHWGTNSQGWGGIATPGVARYMFVKKFSFTPA